VLSAPTTQVENIEAGSQMRQLYNKSNSKKSYLIFILISSFGVIRKQNYSWMELKKNQQQNVRKARQSAINCPSGLCLYLSTAITVDHFNKRGE